MDNDQSNTGDADLDLGFERVAYEHMRKAQRRSLISAIEQWLDSAKLFRPTVLVNTDTLFPKIGPAESKVASFLPEVYACIDQLLIVLALAAVELHRVADMEKD